MAARFLKLLTDSEPAVVVAFGLGASGILVAGIGPRVRHALGLETDQYFGYEDPDGGWKAAPNSIGKIGWAKEEVGTKPELVKKE